MSLIVWDGRGVPEREMEIGTGNDQRATTAQLQMLLGY